MKNSFHLLIAGLFLTSCLADDLLARGRGGARGGSARGGSARGGSVSRGSARGGSVSGGAAKGGTARGGSVSGGAARGGTVRGGSFSGGTARAGGSGRPTQSQLQGHVGLPSDGGFGAAKAGQLPGLGGGGGGGFSVSGGGAAKGGTIGGVTGGAAKGGVRVTGPRGNTRTKVGGAAGVTTGNRGAVVGGTATRGVGPNRTTVGGVATGPGGTAGFRATGGSRGAVAGGARVGYGGAAGGRVAVRGHTGTAVRGNWHAHHHGHHHGYRHGWHVKYPGAWFVAGWTARAIWSSASWSSTSSYVGTSTESVNYDYGTTIIYEGDTVYQDGQKVASAEEYYDQAENLAEAGQSAKDEPDPKADDWLPLGVFVATREGETEGNRIFQLAVNKQGIIRGNYEDTLVGNVEPIHGSVDKKTQRAAWSVGNNKQVVIETGLVNLTQDEAPALVHFNKDQSQQVLLVRLKEQEEQPEQAAGEAKVLPGLQPQTQKP